MNLKRIALGLLVVVLLGLAGGAGWWWWTHRTGPNAADYLPEGTFLFVHIPDAEATRQAYLTSRLHSLVNNPDIPAMFGSFWKSAWDSTGSESKKSLATSGELLELLGKNLTGEAFLAITSVDFITPDNIRFIAGVKPKQGLGDIAPLVARIKQLSAEPMRNAKTGKGNRAGFDYEWVTLDNNKTRLYYGAVGPWEIVSIGEPAYFDFIDRFQAKGKAPGSLAQTAAYQSVLKRLPGRQDMLAYVALEGVRPALLKLTETNAAFRRSGSSIKQLCDQLKGAAWSAKFENGRVRETLVSLMPKATRPDLGKSYEPCAYKTLPMTSSQTYLYYAQNFDFRKYWDYSLDLYTKTNPELADNLKQAPAWAQAQGLDFNKNVLDALGGEYAIVLDWPGDALVPDLAIVCEVANPADFKPTVDVLMQNLTPLLSMNPTGGNLEDAQAGNYALKTYRMSKLPLISPTLVVSGDRFGIFLTQTGAKRMLSSTGSDSLAKQNDFKTLGGDQLSGTSSLAYLNLGGLLDHAYITAKPYMSLAAMMSPEMQKVLGSGKLPDKLTFTADIGSLLMRTRFDDDGATVQSLSNIGTMPLLAGGTAVITAVAYQQNKTRTAHRPSAPRSTSPTGDPTADSVKAELEELRAVIEAYAVANDVAKGTAVNWASITPYLVPDSPLQKRGGKDPLGNAYLLGTVGEAPASVAPETKAKFSDRDDAFWSSATPATQ